MAEQEREPVVEGAVAPEALPEETKVVEEVKEERPEENYKAEIARKNAEIARLRSQQVESDAPKVVKYDPQDITTWNDNELKMLSKSNDANLARYKEQAEDLILERKVRAMQARQYEDDKKAAAHMKLEAEYPEALDPTSDMSQKISKVMREYDLSRTPAGRLVAAKIVAAESKATATKGQTKEADRVARVKGQMVDGDRPKPTEVKNPKGKIGDVKDKLMNSKDPDGQTEAVNKILRDRGLNSETFFKRAR